MNRITTVLAAAILVAAVGCDSKPAPPVAQTPMPAQPAAGAAKEKDLVCGMDVSADAPLSFDHEGKTYRFCAQACLDSFKADPAKYIKK